MQRYFQSGNDWIFPPATTIPANLQLYIFGATRLQLVAPLKRYIS